MLNFHSLNLENVDLYVFKKKKKNPQREFVLAKQTNDCRLTYHVILALFSLLSIETNKHKPSGSLRSEMVFLRVEALWLLFLRGPWLDSIFPPPRFKASIWERRERLTVPAWLSIMIHMWRSCDLHQPTLVLSVGKRVPHAATVLFLIFSLNGPH